MIISSGIYKNLSNEDYHASAGISNSQMGYLLPPYSPKQFWYQYLSGKVQKKDETHFSVGSAVHTLVFERETFKERFHTVTEVPKRTSTLGKAAYDAMERTAAGRCILDKAEQEEVFEMAANITNHDIWRALKRGNSGCIEDSLAWVEPESGVLLRSRPDFYNEDIIIDLKTTKDSSPSAFKRAVTDYGYHRQAALAVDGLTQLTGRRYENVLLFVVDKNPPYPVRCYVLSDRAIEQGRIEYKMAAMNYKYAIESGEWADHEQIIENIDLPEWAYRRFDNE
jgi:hypothetical protein